MECPINSNFLCSGQSMVNSLVPCGLPFVMSTWIMVNKWAELDMIDDYLSTLASFSGQLCQNFIQMYVNIHTNFKYEVTETPWPD